MARSAVHDREFEPHDGLVGVPPEKAHYDIILACYGNVPAVLITANHV